MRKCVVSGRKQGRGVGRAWAALTLGNIPFHCLGDRTGEPRRSAGALKASSSSVTLGNHANPSVFLLDSGFHPRPANFRSMHDSAGAQRVSSRCANFATPGEFHQHSGFQKPHFIQRVLVSRFQIPRLLSIPQSAVYQRISRRFQIARSSRFPGEIIFDAPRLSRFHLDFVRYPDFTRYAITSRDSSPDECYSTRSCHPHARPPPARTPKISRFGARLAALTFIEHAFPCHQHQRRPARRELWGSKCLVESRQGLWVTGMRSQNWFSMSFRFPMPLLPHHHSCYRDYRFQRSSFMRDHLSFFRPPLPYPTRQ